MGDAKRKRAIQQYSREEFLRENSCCCYCGKVATTTDHCPARAFFLDRRWPEGYEFPSCNSCNQENRIDELVVAMLCRVWFARPRLSPKEREHFQKLVRGVANNAPGVIVELQGDNTRRSQRTAFRDLFGENKGDRYRLQGYRSAPIGPLTRDAIDRFQVKLAKALYYKHSGQILDGEIWSVHLSAADAVSMNPVIETLLSITPFKAKIIRCGSELNDQFIYRYNCSSKPAALLFAVVQFSDQMMFHIVAADHRFRKSAGGSMGALDESPFSEWHTDARLSLFGA